MSGPERDVRLAIAWAVGGCAVWEVMLTGTRWRWCEADRALVSGRLSARLSPAAPPFPGRALQVAVRLEDGREYALERTVPGWLFGGGDGPDGGERVAA